MLLFTQRNATDTRLTLVCNAIHLHDIVDFRSSDERKPPLRLLNNSIDMLVFPFRSRRVDLPLREADDAVQDPLPEQMPAIRLADDTRAAIENVATFHSR